MTSYHESPLSCMGVTIFDGLACSRKKRKERKGKYFPISPNKFLDRWCGLICAGGRALIGSTRLRSLHRETRLCCHHRRASMLWNHHRCASKLRSYHRCTGKLRHRTTGLVSRIHGLRYSARSVHLLLGGKVGRVLGGHLWVRYLWGWGINAGGEKVGALDGGRPDAVTTSARNKGEHE